MEYTIVVQSNVEELERVVNDLLKNGWKPLGSPQYNHLGNVSWIQAMIKES
ncbi:MAG: DUF1737 domain-containing protein [Treponema sp.]|nr:DUF1737 domain-containing protein [Treponema sp.]